MFDQTWQAIIKDNESLRLPNVEDYPQVVSIFGNEIHIDDAVIRVPVLKEPQVSSTTQDKTQEKTQVQKVDASTSSNNSIRFIWTQVIPVLQRSYKFPEFNEDNFYSTFNDIAVLLKMEDYKTNMYSFWTIDTLCSLIWDCQTKMMLPDNQTITANWFFYFIEAVKCTHLGRKDFFKVIEIFLSRTGEWMTNMNTIVIPRVLEIPVKSPERKKIKKKGKEGSIGKLSIGIELPIELDDSTFSSQPFLPFDSEIAITQEDLVLLAKGLYEIFAGRLDFEIISEAFWNEPLVEELQLTARIMVPKPLKLVTGPQKADEDSKFKHVQSSIGAKKKSLAKKSISKKSIAKKSISKKSISKKSISKKSIAKKSITKGGRRQSAKGGATKATPKAKDSKGEQSLAAESSELDTAKGKEKIEYILKLSESVNEKFILDLFADVDLNLVPRKWLKDISQSIIAGYMPKSRKGSRRQSNKRGSMKRGSTKRGSTKRGSTKRGSTKRGSTKRGSTKRGSTRRQSKK